MSTDSLYLYGIGAAELDTADLPAGLADAPVHGVAAGVVTAIVSRIDASRKLRPERRNLAAHQRVLTALMSRGGILPMGFGHVVDSDAALGELLSRHGGALSEQLGRVGGRQEMGLRISIAGVSAVDYIVSRHPELVAAREAIAAGRASREDMIRAGQAFDQTLTAEREAHVARVEAALGPAAVELKFNGPRSESEMINLAALVAGDGAEAFEAAVTALAETYGDEYRFDLSGPFAPYNFVTLNLAA